jgi:hypothetical protein
MQKMKVSTFSSELFLFAFTICDLFCDFDFMNMEHIESFFNYLYPFCLR